MKGNAQNLKNTSAPPSLKKKNETSEGRRIGWAVAGGYRLLASPAAAAHSPMRRPDEQLHTRTPRTDEPTTNAAWCVVLANRRVFVSLAGTPQWRHGNHPGPPSFYVQVSLHHYLHSTRLNFVCF